MNLDRGLRTGLLAAGLIAAALAAVAVLGGPRETSIGRLRIGVLPDEAPEILRARFAPLVHYLSDSIGLPCELVVPEDYAALVRQFADGEIGLAYFGGLTFVQAEAGAGAIPLVTRDRDLDFRSYFLVRAGNPAKSLADLKGARFAFGSSLSTSGHLMPRFFMQRDGLNPEEWFSEVRYSGAHDQTAYWVRDGDVDVGVANGLIVDAMFADGRLDRGAIRILQRTLPYTDYVWAVQPDIPDEVRTRLRDAFLALTRGRPDHAGILGRLGAGAFLPALSSDFVRLRQIAAELSLLDRAGR